jgi:hypothetical protein
MGTATATATKKTEQTRECSSCGEVKPLCTYKLRMSGKPRQQCRACLNARSRARRAAKRDAEAWHTVDITPKPPAPYMEWTPAAQADFMDILAARGITATYSEVFGVDPGSQRPRTADV